MSQESSDSAAGCCVLVVVILVLVAILYWILAGFDKSSKLASRIAVLEEKVKKLETVVEVKPK